MKINGFTLLEMLL
ncbi:prepilin-type N-terminal cleavage/methylation domain-containing protein, partial [Listeria monocytogenes]|nr:prepilin-type N-terminal cleavage/methylation domain-containing protein [Listeria monocytogenes]